MLLGQQVIQDREYRFLDLACVLGASDEHELHAKIDEHECFRVRAVYFRNGLEVGNLQDRELRFMGLEICIGAADEHGPGKKVVPGSLGDDADRQLIAGIGAGVAVLDEDIFALKIGRHTTQEVVELAGISRTVDLAPPDLVLARLLADDELVVRGTARVAARSDDQRASVCQDALATPDGFLDEGRRRQIPVNLMQVRDAEIGKIDGFSHWDVASRGCVAPACTEFGWVRRAPLHACG